MGIKTLSSIIAILLCIGISAFAALDLQFMTAITQTPNPANTGNIVTFKVTFKTVGGAVDNMKITGGIDSSQVFERTYAHINANLQRTDSFTWTAAAGSHIVWFELDPGKTAGDSNYSNNRVEKSFTISAPLAEFKYIPEEKIDWSRLSEPKPDLIILSFQLIPVMPGAQIKVNNTITYKVVVKNIGTSTAKDSILGIEFCNVNGYPLSCVLSNLNAVYHIPEIDPQGMREIIGSILVSQVGSFIIRTRADDGSSITESNERNNNAWKNLHVIP